MEDKVILGHIDYTLLKPQATLEQIKKLCEEAIAYNTASVCIPPSYVKEVSALYGERLVICTVIGFPNGYSSTESKVFEVKHAIESGATELDVVVNLGDIKNGNFEKVRFELDELRKATKDYVLKIIIETSELTESEKVEMSKLVTESKADYIKTSTGFASGGATFEDIELIKNNIGKDLKIKASGGIRKKEDMQRYLKMGVSRLGLSSIHELK